MMGICRAPDLSARITVNACGGVEIVWDNDTGQHDAYYVATERLPGGGFLADSDIALGAVFPNDAETIGIKPAERGAIQMITPDWYGNVTGVYRLVKVA